MSFQQILDYSTFDFSVIRWGLALVVLVTVVLVLSLIKRVFTARIRRWSENERMRGLKNVDAIFGKTAIFLFLAIGLFVGVELFVVDDEYATWSRAISQVLVALQVGVWLSAACTVCIRNYTDKIQEDAVQVTAFSAIKFVIQLGVWSVIFLMILDNLGFDITALIASLGIGGIALALAAQNILGDLFGFFSIIVDKPFVQGDFIIIDDHLGTIEHIGIKTTRIRSLSGEQLIFSNQDLLTSRIRNFKRMQERRVVLQIGVTFDTPTEQLRNIPDLIADYLHDEERTRFDRAHFRGVGQSAFEYEIVYWVLDPDFNIHMDVQQQFLLWLVEEFRSRDIHFAFPTRMIHFGQDEDYGDTPKAETTAESTAVA